MIERLAALSAGAVAPLLVKEPPEPAIPNSPPSPEPIPGPDAPPPGLPGRNRRFPSWPRRSPRVADLASAKPASPRRRPTRQRKQESGRLRVAVRRVTGAPGDGGTSLAGRRQRVLRQQDLTVVEPGGKADVTIDGEVSVAPAGSGKQHVKIVWHVRDASGAELGTVGQENDVPRGLLSGSWGDVAYVVAAAAGDGLLQVLARAAPPATAGGRHDGFREATNAGSGSRPAVRLRNPPPPP